MEIYGKNFTEPILNGIRMMIEEEPEISRRSLSRKICENEEWRSVNGKLQEMSCRKALLKLDRSGIINLPERKESYAFEKRQTHTIDYKIAAIEGSLSDLGELIIEPIKSRYRKDSRVWFQLMENYHYLRSARLCGSQIRYIVKSEKHGYIGALAFSSATFKLSARDAYIGWSEKARRENIGLVISNDRFLILPTVKVNNLASWIFGKVFQRLGDDWESVYGQRPVLVESYVDPSRFKGIIYRASNWEYVGKTSGRRDGIAKDVFLYPLERNWREILCKESRDALGFGKVNKDSSNWAEREFGSIRVYDNRLKERLYTIARDFYNKPEANIPEACGSKARTIGAYRFFQNKKVTMNVILDAHTEATIERIKEHKIVLVPQDTTTLDYSTHPMTEGLGPTGTQDTKSIGLILHDTLALSEDGTPLGVLDAQVWARDWEDRGKSSRRKQLPIEQKESMKWLRSYRKVSEIQKLCSDTLLVSIGDRESDIFELFQETQKVDKKPGLLVRVGKNRNRRVGQDELWEYISKLEESGQFNLHIPRRGNRKARDARMSMRYSQIVLEPPKQFSSSKPIDIWAVYIKELNPPEDVKTPLEWMLFTTVSVDNFNDALQRVQWYTKRWGIEVYHRVLKSGCRIKNRQLANADRLETALGVDMVVAWRIYHMTMLGRELPDASASVFFKEEEWKALYCYVHKTPIAPEEPLSLREAIRMVGRIGGHLGRKSDGEPGTVTLWRGLQRLDTATEMYVIFTSSSRDGP